jgi:ZIP family zinc transporter
VFLVWDVVTHAWEPIDTALGRLHDGAGPLVPVTGYGALFLAGHSVGLLSLVGYEVWRPAVPTPVCPVPCQNSSHRR